MPSPISSSSTSHPQQPPSHSRLGVETGGPAVSAPGAGGASDYGRMDGDADAARRATAGDVEAALRMLGVGPTVDWAQQALGEPLLLFLLQNVVPRPRSGDCERRIMSGTLTRVHETLTSEQIQRVLEISGLLDLNEESAAELLLESRRKAQFFTPGTSSVNIVMRYFFADTCERLELIFYLFLQENSPTCDPEVCQVIHQFTDALMSARPNNLLSLLIGRFRVAILSSENGNFGTLFRDECFWLAACINAICSTRSERLEQNFEELTNLLQMISGRFPDPFNGTNSFKKISVDILFGVMHCVLPDVRLPTNMLATLTALPDPYSAPISLCLSISSEDLKLSNESVRSAFSKNVFQYLSHFVGSDTFEYNNTTCEIIGTLLSRVLQGFLSKPYASSQPKAMADILGLIYGLYKRFPRKAHYFWFSEPIEDMNEDTDMQASQLASTFQPHKFIENVYQQLSGQTFVPFVDAMSALVYSPKTAKAVFDFLNRPNVQPRCHWNHFLSMLNQFYAAANAKKKMNQPVAIPPGDLQAYVSVLKLIETVLGNDAVRRETSPLNVINVLFSVGYGSPAPLRLKSAVTNAISALVDASTASTIWRRLEEYSVFGATVGIKNDFENESSQGVYEHSRSVLALLEKLILFDPKPLFRNEGQCLYHPSYLFVTETIFANMMNKHYVNDTEKWAFCGSVLHWMKHILSLYSPHVEDAIAIKVPSSAIPHPGLMLLVDILGGGPILRSLLKFLLDYTQPSGIPPDSCFPCVQLVFEIILLVIEKQEDVIRFITNSHAPFSLHMLHTHLRDKQAIMKFVGFLKGELPAQIILCNLTFLGYLSKKSDKGAQLILGMPDEERKVLISMLVYLIIKNPPLLEGGPTPTGPKEMRWYVLRYLIDNVTGTKTLGLALLGLHAKIQRTDLVHLPYASPVHAVLDILSEGGAAEAKSSPDTFALCFEFLYHLLNSRSTFTAVADFLQSQEFFHRQLPILVTLIRNAHREGATAPVTLAVSWFIKSMTLIVSMIPNQLFASRLLGLLFPSDLQESQNSIISLLSVFQAIPVGSSDMEDIQSTPVNNHLGGLETCCRALKQLFVIFFSPAIFQYLGENSYDTLFATAARMCKILEEINASYQSQRPPTVVLSLTESLVAVTAVFTQSAELIQYGPSTLFQPQVVQTLVHAYLSARSDFNIRGNLLSSTLQILLYLNAVSHTSTPQLIKSAVTLIKPSYSTFLEQVCSDALTAPDAWKAVALSMLDFLVAVDSVGDVMAVITSRGHLLAMVMKLPSALNPSAIESSSLAYQSLTSFLLRVASHPEGAMHLAQEGIIHIIGECPWLEVPMKGTIWSRHYSRWCERILQLINCLLITLKGNVELATQVASLVQAKYSEFSYFLRDDEANSSLSCSQRSPLHNISLTISLFYILYSCRYSEVTTILLTTEEVFHAVIMNCFNKYCCDSPWPQQVVTELASLDPAKRGLATENLNLSAQNICSYVVLYSRARIESTIAASGKPQLFFSLEEEPSTMDETCKQSTLRHLVTFIKKIGRRELFEGSAKGNKRFLFGVVESALLLLWRQTEVALQQQPTGPRAPKARSEITQLLTENCPPVPPLLQSLSDLELVMKPNIIATTTRQLRQLLKM